MFSLLKKYLNYLEDPLYPCLGPHLRLLKLTGLWRTELKTNKAKIKIALYYITVTFFLTQYVKCALNFDLDSLKLILQYAPFHMGVVKTCFFQKDFKQWKRLIEYISSVEQYQISKKDIKQDTIMEEYIKRSRKVTYFFWGLAFFSNFAIFSEPYQKNEVFGNGTGNYLYVFDGYTPFGRDPPGYYCSMLVQTVLGHLMSAYVVGWDMLTVAIMIFFVGQLKMSQLYCSNVVVKDVGVSRSNIAQCHRFHTTLVYYQKQFNSLISPVMAFYLFVVSVNLGVCIIQISEIENDLATLVSSCVYIVACLIQLLVFYWHANEVTVESGYVSYSTFKSSWPEAHQYLQNEIQLLGSATSKRLLFKAGPFNEMSLATFISILRGSYSFYTLLKETN